MNCDQEHHWQLWQGLRAGVLWKNAKRLSFWGPRGPLVLPLIGPPSACPQEFLLLLLLLQMIICKRPVPLDDHFKEAGPFGWSFVRGRPLPMIICRRLAVLDDHLQEAGPFGWSFARGVRSTLSTPSPLSPYHLCQDPDSISRTFLEQFVLFTFYSTKLISQVEDSRRCDDKGVRSIMQDYIKGRVNIHCAVSHFKFHQQFLN